MIRTFAAGFRGRFVLGVGRFMRCLHTWLRFHTKKWYRNCAVFMVRENLNI